MRTLLFLALAAASSAAFAKPVTENVTWEVDGKTFAGVLVYDDAGGDAAGKRPGLVMFPNWMGVTDTAVNHAQTIAGLDYVVLLADMDGEGVRPAGPEDAGAAAKAVYDDRPGLRRRAAAALDVLRRSDAPFDPERVAAFGFCFGGAVALELARSGSDIDGAVRY